MENSKLSEKIVILVLDKLLIGLLAALIVFYFQNRSQEAAKLMDQVSAVTKFRSDILVEGRTKLTKATLEYLSVLDKIKREPDKKNPITEYQQLTQSADAVALVSRIVCDVDPFLRESILNLSSTMRELPTNQDQIATLEEKQKEISRCYLKVMESFQTVLRSVVIKEYSYAKKSSEHSPKIDIK